MRTRHLAGGLVVLGALAVGYFGWRSRPESATPRANAAERAARPAGREALPGTAQEPRPEATSPSRVHRLAPAERRRLGEQIAEAAKRARNASSRSSATRATADDGIPLIPLEEVGKPLQDALTETIPILAECYTRAGSAAPPDAAARMTMISDPELGTVIDTEEVTDADGNALDRELDTCLRDAIDSLALPPLGQPGKLQIEYTFRF